MEVKFNYVVEACLVESCTWWSIIILQRIIKNKIIYHKKVTCQKQTTSSSRRCCWLLVAAAWILDCQLENVLSRDKDHFRLIGIRTNIKRQNFRRR
jgi:hypothetical protein